MVVPEGSTPTLDSEYSTSGTLCELHTTAPSPGTYETVDVPEVIVVSPGNNKPKVDDNDYFHDNDDDDVDDDSGIVIVPTPRGPGQ